MSIRLDYVYPSPVPEANLKHRCKSGVEMTDKTAELVEGSYHEWVIIYLMHDW